MGARRCHAQVDPGGQRRPAVRLLGVWIRESGALMKPHVARHAVALCFFVTFAAFAQQSTVFEDRPAVVLGNDKVELTVITEGGAMAQILLADEKDKVNPL